MAAANTSKDAHCRGLVKEIGFELRKAKTELAAMLAEAQPASAPIAKPARKRVKATA